MPRKILIIAVFVLIVAGLGMLLYFVFFRITPKAPVQPPTTITPTGKLPITREAWEKMTVEQRRRAGLPLYEWPGVKPTTAKKPTMPEIAEIASGGKTWVHPLSTDTTKGAVLSADGKNSIYYNKADGKFYQIDAYGNRHLLSDQTFNNVDKINWSPNKNQAILEYPDGFKVMYDFQKQKQYSLPKKWENF
jgi:hypothetical protein